MIALRRQVLSVQPAAQRAEVEAAIQYRRRGERVPKDLYHSLSMPERGRADMHDPDFNGAIREKAQTKMRMMDAWPSDVRAAAHEHGQEVVQQFWQAGVRSGRQINHLIAVVRGHMQPFGNKRPGKP